MVTIASSRTTVLTEARPTGPCLYSVVADDAGTPVFRDGVHVADRPEIGVPHVAELATDAPGTGGCHTRSGRYV